MYNSDWLSEENMTKWEKISDNNKMWSRCQQFFKAAYIARKWYMDAKRQKQEHANKIAEADLQLYLAATEAKAQQDTTENTECALLLATSGYFLIC